MTYVKYPLDETMLFSNPYHFIFSTKLSSTKDDFLEGGDISLNVELNDTSTLSCSNH